jgi:NAD+-dependent protein deacetylase SIR2
MEHLKIEPNKAANIKYYNFIEMLKSGKFKKISFLTGAGISTTAGIPDFRSSENGLFKTLQEKYKLETPEQFFDINFFNQKPELFYEFAKEFDVEKYNATPTHWFMSFLNHKGLLHLIFTQNIDSLELKAKVPKEKIVFAHGNLSESHCSICKKDVDHKILTQHIHEGKTLYCDSVNCKGPVKPKVIFYGEKLPIEFFDKISDVANSDLAFIMGTSLKVMPFNMLPYQLEKSAWRVVVNREKVGHFHYDDVSSSDVFIQGTTDEQILKIVEDCGWKEEFDHFVKEHSNL